MLQWDVLTDGTKQCAVSVQTLKGSVGSLRRLVELMWMYKHFNDISLQPCDDINAVENVYNTLWCRKTYYYIIYYDAVSVHAIQNTLSLIYTLKYSPSENVLFSPVDCVCESFFLLQSSHTPVHELFLLFVRKSLPSLTRCQTSFWWQLSCFSSCE